MLGWMLKRGSSAPEVDLAADTTEVEAPDTPAPVFAARAIKGALFGAQNADTRAQQCAQRRNSAASRLEAKNSTPSRPTGILLTPGTGTSKRKRVSFGHDISARSKSKKPSDADPALSTSDEPIFTRFAQKLEKANTESLEHKAASETHPGVNAGTDDEWEETDDDYCSHDVTVDLAEPHSRSGKYWKEEFRKYREDAQIELDKLVKYKQQVKDYARQRDSEAVQLAEKLRNEQQKVIEMEQKISESASRIASGSRRVSDRAHPELLGDLAKQTALAVQYRQRVQELEDQLASRGKVNRNKALGESDRHSSSAVEDELLRLKKDLQEAQAELRTSAGLRNEVAELKSQLKAVREEKSDVVVSGEDGPAIRARNRELRSRLRNTQTELKEKDEQIRQLTKDFDSFRKETSTREEDTKAVLERAHDKVAELKKEVRSLKAGAMDQPRERRSWQPTTTGVARIADEVALRPRSPLKFDSDEPQIDLARLASADISGLKKSAARSTNLREEYQTTTTTSQDKRDLSEEEKGSKLQRNRPDIGQPKWREYIPRSPRNRGYLGEDALNKIQNGGVTPASDKTKIAADPDLSALAQSLAKTRTVAHRSAEVGVDLLQDRFSRLGGPEDQTKIRKDQEEKEQNASASSGNVSQSSIAPEKRAAIMARIEERMAQKKLAQRQGVYDKENVKP